MVECVRQEFSRTSLVPPERKPANATLNCSYQWLLNMHFIFSQRDHIIISYRTPLFGFRISQEEQPLCFHIFLRILIPPGEVCNQKQELPPIGFKPTTISSKRPREIDSAVSAMLKLSSSAILLKNIIGMPEDPGVRCFESIFSCVLFISAEIRVVWWIK